MGGEYVVYLTDARPYIDNYEPNLAIAYPHVNIASEDVTFALNDAKLAARSDAINIGLTLVVIALGIIGLRPVFKDYVDERFTRFDGDEV
jgi:hypothetical protein